jgi:outer membrane protein
VREANGRVKEAMAGAFPQITGSLTYTRQLESLYSDLSSDTTGGLGNLFKNSPFAAANSWNAELHAEQLLWAGGKVGAGIKAAHAYRNAAHEQQKETSADVVFQVKQAYLDAVLALRVAGIAESTLSLARDQLRQVGQYRAQGSKAEYDLLRARVDAGNQEPAAVSARNAADIALLALKRLVNVPAGQALELSTSLDSEDGRIPVPLPDSLGSTGRPALVAAEENVRVQEQAVRVALADRWPSLSASATLSNEAFPGDFFPGTGEFKRNWSAGFKLSFPVFLGFRTEGAAERARAQVQEAEATRDMLRETVRLQVEQARLSLQNARSLLGAQRQTVRWARRAFELAQVRYSNGMATQLEVSDARLQMQSAQVHEVQVTRDYLVALAQLERAVGRALPVAMRPLDQLDGQVREEGK